MRLNPSRTEKFCDILITPLRMNLDSCDVGISLGHGVRGRGSGTVCEGGAGARCARQGLGHSVRPSRLFHAFDDSSHHTIGLTSLILWYHSIL